MGLLCLLLAFIRQEHGCYTKSLVASSCKLKSGSTNQKVRQKNSATRQRRESLELFLLRHVVPYQAEQYYTWGVNLLVE